MNKSTELPAVAVVHVDGLVKAAYKGMPNDELKELNRCLKGKNFSLNNGGWIINSPKFGCQKGSRTFSVKFIEGGKETEVPVRDGTKLVQQY